MSHPTLLDIGVDAYSHQIEVDELRQQLNIRHHYFDCWLYGFLENKKFNVEETLEKIRRRHTFEKETLAQHVITDWITESMQKGIMQIIGNDKDGRVVFYVTTCRDRPEAHQREEKTRTFDMMVSYGTRLRADCRRCQMALLINQEKASLWKNTDMTFQANIALRIAKFYPGCVDRIYICNMNSMLAAMAKPIFAQFPPIVSERIIIITDSEKRAGKLLEFIDEAVLPVALGGTNDCDRQENYTQFYVTIKEYYEQLKHAVLQRGLTVKEWELESIFPHGLPEATPMRADGLSSAPPQYSDDGCSNTMWKDVSSDSNDVLGTESVDLLTCDTLLPNMYSFSPHAATVSVAIEGRDLMAEYVEQFVLVESLFRTSVTEMFDREWLSIVQREEAGRRRLRDAEQNFQRNTLMFRRMPKSVRLLAQGCVWFSLMLMALHFLLATIFLAVFGCCCMALFFFSMFSRPYNIFPYGSALLVTGCQLALFCTRGFELTRRTYSGELIDALRAFGYKALLVQVALSSSAVFAFFLIFCIMSLRYDAITGVQYSLAVGWFVALSITLLYHLLYAFGVANGSRKTSSSATGMTALYFFLDVDLDANQMAMSPPTSVMTIPCIAMLAAFSSGLSYMLSGGITYLAISVATTSVAALLVVLFVNADHTVYTGSLLISAALYISVAWMDVVVTMETHSWKSEWGVSAGIVMCLSLLTAGIVLGYMWTPLRNTRTRRWLFRAAWVWIILHLNTCTLVMFIMDYRLGLLNLALGIYLLMYRFCVNEGSSTYGVLAVVIGFVLVLLSCILLSGTATSTVYSNPASEWLPSNYKVPNAAPSHSQLMSDAPRRPFAPVCQIQFPDTLDIVDMALFAKMSNADALNATLTDLRAWFPDFTYVNNHTFPSKSFLQLKFFRRVTDRFTTTVVTLGSTPDPYAAIESTMMWVDVLMLSLFAAFTPARLFLPLVSSLSMVDGLASLLWTSTVAHAQEEVNAYLASFNASNHYVYLVGHGVAGAAASLLRLASFPEALTVTFASPVNAAAWRNGQELTLSALPSYTLSVVPSSSVLAPWWMWGPLTETIPCNPSNKNCFNMDAVVQQLHDICRIANRAS